MGSHDHRPASRDRSSNRHNLRGPNLRGVGAGHRPEIICQVVGRASKLRYATVSNSRGHATHLLYRLTPPKPRCEHVTFSRTAPATIFTRLPRRRLGGRQAFGGSQRSSSFKTRLIIAAIIAIFALVSYYGKSGRRESSHRREATRRLQRRSRRSGDGAAGRSGNGPDARRSLARREPPRRWSQESAKNC